MIEWVPLAFAAGGAVVLALAGAALVLVRWLPAPDWE